MKNSVSHIVTAVLTATAAFAVSYVVSHSNVRVRISWGESSGWMKHKMGRKFYEHAHKKKHGTKWPRHFGLGPFGVENAIVKLTVAKEQGFLSEDEYGKFRSILTSPIAGVSKEEDEAEEENE